MAFKNLTSTYSLSGPNQSLTSTDDPNSDVPSTESAAPNERPVRQNIEYTNLQDQCRALRRELERKDVEIKRLHGILQSGQRSDELSDNDVHKRFQALQIAIHRLMSPKHISKTRSDARSEALRLMTKDDQFSWLAATTADSIHRGTFMRRFFGLGEEFESNQVEFETFLENNRQKVTQSDIASWRAETAKISGKLQLSDGTRIRKDQSREILDLLKDHVELKNTNETIEAVELLAKLAYDLAFDQRKSKIVYEWRQKIDDRVEPTHYNILEDYHEPEKGFEMPRRVLFGPVIRVDGSNDVCIREGDILVPGSDWGKIGKE